MTHAQELFDIARGGTTLGWSGHYVHEAAKNPEGVVSASGSGVGELGFGGLRLWMLKFAEVARAIS